MIRMRFIFFFLFSLLILSCSESRRSDTDPKNLVEVSVQNEKREPMDTTLLVNTIDNKRLEIETQLEQIEKVEIKTDSLRAKITQKWSRIHYYLSGGKVVRMKTYPHPEVSTRTEEFYFNEGDLILVAVEDNGLGLAGKEKGLIDKLYYFHQGLFLVEYNTSKERGTGIKQWESEELKQEAMEYLAILQAQQ